MRDFRDAKLMAHALRETLSTKGLTLTHSECLDLVAKAFGLENWNTLSAKIEAARPEAHADPAPAPVATYDPVAKNTVHCSFCGKSQRQVKTLIAGPPPAFVCNECVGLCNDILDDQEIFTLLIADETQGQAGHPAAIAHLRGKPREQLVRDGARARQAIDRLRGALQEISRRIEQRPGEAPTAGEVSWSPGYAYLMSKSRDELIALHASRARELQRYQDIERLVASALDEGARG
jgi:hypothetical protein